MTQGKVLFIGDLDESLPQFIKFKESFEVVHYKLTTKEKFKDDLNGNDLFSGIVGIYCGWAGFMPIGGLTSDLIDLLPSTLKIVVSCAVGYDPYDTEALQSKGIRFYNTPSLGADHVADTVLWHVLEAFRHFSVFQQQTRLVGNCVVVRGELQSHGYDHSKGQLGQERTQWEKNSYPFGHILGGLKVEGPKGRKIGLVGFGKIGQKIGKRCDALGMEIQYHKRSELSPEESSSLSYKAQFVPQIENLVSSSDVIVICCPGNKSTMNLLNKQVLDLAKPNSKFINVGRGSIIDEQHLITKLTRGEIGFIGLDVYTGEPIINPSLIHRQDVSLTPHIGSSTVDVFDNTAIASLENLYNELVLGVEGRSRIV